jgi:hypothetical protein
MVSPQPIVDGLWPHHQDPPQLWPKLAGLSVLVHLVLLGLGLPLLLRIAPPVSDTESVTVPIELVAPGNSGGAPTEANQPRSAPPAPSQTPIQPQPDGATAARAPSPQSSRSRALVKPPSPQREAFGSPTTPLPDTRPAASARNDETPPVAEANPTASRATSPAPEQSSPAGQATGESENEDNVNPGANPGGETPNSANPEPEASDAQTEHGTAGVSDSTSDSPAETAAGSASTTEPQPLPELASPPLEPPRENASVPASAFFVTYLGLRPLQPTEAPDEIDWPEQYPQLRSAPSQSIVLYPRDANCEAPTTVTPATVSLRVVIQRDGTIASARPWPRGVGGDLANFAACLVPQSGFSFTPARTNGIPSATDKVILEVQVQSGS